MEYTKPEVFISVMARLLKDAENAFLGVASIVPVISVLVGKELYNPNLTILSISGAVNPKPSRLASLSTVHPFLFENARSQFTLTEIFDLSARGELDIAFLGGIQVDRKGRINRSVIGSFNKPKVRLPGGAGTAVLMPTVRRVVLWRTKHDRRAFVEEVDFATAAGNVYKCVTPLCLFGFDGELYVEALFPGVTEENIIDNTGFEVRFAEGIYEIEQPTEEELELIREIDRENLRGFDFK